MWFLYFVFQPNFHLCHVKYSKPFLFTPYTGQGRSVGELKLAPRDEQLESESKEMWRLEPSRLVAQHFSPWLRCIFPQKSQWDSLSFNVYLLVKLPCWRHMGAIVDRCKRSADQDFAKILPSLEPLLLRSLSTPLIFSFSTLKFEQKNTSPQLKNSATPSVRWNHISLNLIFFGRTFALNVYFCFHLQCDIPPSQWLAAFDWWDIVRLEIPKMAKVVRFEKCENEVVRFEYLARPSKKAT